MSHLENVTESLGSLQFMQHAEADALRGFIARHDLKQILEVGFFHGKSSAYLAAILEDLGRGHLVTVDKKSARKCDPDIETVLAGVGLSHRVTPIFADRSFTWELGKMIMADPRPQFDLCYFDADHTWEGTGFGFVLADRLLRPGGWILFDDLEWTMEKSMAQFNKAPKGWMARSADERATAPVRMVFDTLVKEFGYEERHVINGGWWGVARKPLHAHGAGLPATAARNQASCS